MLLARTVQASVSDFKQASGSTRIVDIILTISVVCTNAKRALKLPEMIIVIVSWLVVLLLRPRGGLI